MEAGEGRHDGLDDRGRPSCGQELHREALHYFRQYLIVGGMPQAVAEYAASRDFTRVDAVKRQILRHNRKLYNSGEMKEERRAQIKELLILMKANKHKNQYE